MVQRWCRDGAEVVQRRCRCRLSEEVVWLRWRGAEMVQMQVQRS